MAGLLFLTAIAGLAVTLAEDYGPLNDSSVKTNPVVLYVNPLLFGVSWVSCHAIIIIIIINIIGVVYE